MLFGAKPDTPALFLHPAYTGMVSRLHEPHGFQAVRFLFYKRACSSWCSHKDYFSAKEENDLKKQQQKFLSLLLMLTMLFGMMPMASFAVAGTESSSDFHSVDLSTTPSAITPSEAATPSTAPAPQAETEGTLQFSQDLSGGPLIYPYNRWGSAGNLTVAVGTYTPAGGTAADIPEGTKITYKWYSSTDDIADDSDTSMGSGANYTVRANTIGTKYYYATATAVIDGVNYTGTSSLICVKIKAADIKVTLTVNNRGTLAADKNGDVMCNRSITVSDLDADGKLTYDEALQAAHSTCLTADGYATAQSAYGTSVTKLWGVDTYNCLFYLNDRLPQTTVTETEISAGDRLYASVNTDDTYYSDHFTKFDTTAKTVTENVTFDLTLTDGEGKALSGIAVGSWKDGAFQPMDGIVTDASGKVSLTFAQAGTYYITASGTVRDTVTTDWSTGATAEHDCPIMAPGCIITVKKLGELKFNTQFGEKPYSYKVGETNTFYNLLSASYYVDGVKESGVNASISWYRIGSNSAESEKVEDIRAPFTAADTGMWLYYQYAECDAYGVKLSVRSNFTTVVVSEPTPIEGSDANGFVSDLDYRREYGAGTHPLFQFEQGKTDYTVTELDNDAKECIVFRPVAGKGLWYGIRVNGIRLSGTSDTECDAMTDTVSCQIPSDFITGKTNVVSLLVGTKCDSDQNGSITATDDFDTYDVYNFTVTSLPSVSSISVTDQNDGEIDISPALKYKTYYTSDFYGKTNSETVKIHAGFKGTNGVKLYLGSMDTPFTESVTGQEISLSEYKDEKGVANIPLKTVCEGDDGTVLERTVTLHLSPAAPAPDEPVITVQPAAETAVEKDTTALLTVTVQPVTDGTISYQWMSGSSRYYCEDPIPGATSASYEAPAGNIAGDHYYVCRVTVTTPEGGSSYVDSDVALVTTKLTYVSPPIITVQPGTAANDKGTGVYRTEYTAGSKFDSLYMGVESDSVRVGTSYIYYTEPGCGEFKVQLFYNSEPSAEGGIPIGSKLIGKRSGPYGYYFELQPDTGLPQGEHYVYAVVTSTAEDDPEKSASTVSDFIKMTYTEPDFGLEGSGSAEDPFLLKTAEDFVTIQKAVNEDSITFAGMNFQMANDITLSADWASIGSDGANGRFFGGTLDGNNHKLSYAKGSQPLFKYVSQATIKNLKLYGEEIQGCGLIDDSWRDSNVRAYIDNVTLLSGTSTLKSGLVGSASVAANMTHITNCRAEEGVVIGYTKDQSSISTFTCGFVGSIENCTSAATVYGRDNVGGIAAVKANSMGLFSMKNCSFTGTIEASGSYVGGIAAKGYSNYTAPNATCAVIENCYVNANITGKSEVGGIYGGEGGVDQCWENGTGYIRNNLFYGGLEATDARGAVGGIIGYMRSLNRYNVIENNFYCDTNGCGKAIGGVEHIDTDARAFGHGDDGIFYYNTSRDSLTDIKDVVDAEDKGTADWQYTSVAKTDHNRTDDPMGKDMAKLGKGCTSEEMKDGTILALLNGHENSLKNWIQDKDSPAIGTAAVVKELSISGNYKTEYYIGETLDLSGAVFTAVYSDGSEKEIPAADVTVTGFDSSQRAVLTLTASYGTARTEFEVKVVKQSSSPSGATIKVYFTLLGDEEHGDPTEETGTHTLKDKNLATWIKKTAYTVEENATVRDLLQAVEKDQDVTFSNPSGSYVDKVTFDGVTIGEFDNGTNSGWMFTLNNKHPLLNINQQFLENGDKIVFHYTDDYTVEEGSEPWEEENHPGGGSSATEQPVPDEPQTDTGLPFTDVKAADYFCDAVKWAVEKGITSGTSKTAFSPKADCTRAQMVTFLWRAAGSPKPEGKAIPFTDVKADAYYLTALQWAIENNITSGTSETTFSPDAVCTRGQMAVFLWRAAKSPEVKGSDPFADVKESDYFYTAALWASKEGITSGTSETTFSPKADCTRGQMITFLYRCYGNSDAQGETQTNAKDDAAK